MLIFIFFIVCVLFQIIFWCWFYVPLKQHLQQTTTKQNSQHQPVSVIIAAKNEANNLTRYLPDILNQQYPHFEVVVVDDHSTDETLSVLQSFREKYAHLKIVDAATFKDIPGKKLALTQAIQQTKYDVLLFTDADCMPASKYWIASMVKYFTEGKEIVMGYAPYFKVSGFLNGWVRYETTTTAMNYLSFALRNKTYMGVGRNLAYHKSLFFKTDGYSSHLNISSGDDDLFISQVATNSNVSICLAPETWCYSAAKSNWAAYIKQKQRHVSTATSYQFLTQFLLTLYVFAHFFMYLLLLYFIFFKLFLLQIVFIILIKTLCQYYLYHYLFDHLGEKDLFACIPIFDIALLGYYVLSFPGVITIKRRTWK